MNIIADSGTVRCDWPGCDKDNCQFPGGKPGRTRGSGRRTRA